MIPDPVEIATRLKKAGEVPITITQGADADEEPDTKLPACRVALKVTDPLGKRSPFFQQVDIVAPPHSHIFWIPAKNLGLAALALIGYKKPKSLNVEISAEPINGYQKYYHPAELQQLTMDDTNPLDRSVALQRKQGVGQEEGMLKAKPPTDAEPLEPKITKHVDKPGFNP